MTIRYTLERDFNAATWAVAPLPGAPWASALARWEMPADPVDAGPGPAVQSHLAQAILAIGPALYASADPAAAAATIGQIPAMGARRPALSIVQATTPGALVPAFEARGAAWAMGAQWIAILAPGHGPGSPEIALMSRLFATWAVDPGQVPPSILAILRAAVDGDAAVLHARGPEPLAAFANVWIAS